jgi:hypothetical protein
MQTVGQAHAHFGRLDVVLNAWKKDFPNAERLVKRLVAQKLKLSFVSTVEQLSILIIPSGLKSLNL